MMLPRMHDSPMPMKTVSGRDSETATAPTDELLIWPSVTGAHFMPASVVFQRPPPTAPKYASFGRPFTPDTAIDRPPRSGPMLRHLKALKNVSSGAAAAGCGCAATRPPPSLTPHPTHSASSARHTQKVRRGNMTGIIGLL